MSDCPASFYVALVADETSRDNSIQGSGLSPHEAVENAWLNAGYSEDERPRMAIERDHGGCEWHVVYGLQNQKIGRCSEIDNAWHLYEQIG